MKYLGLDLGTNSIGWALRDESLGDDQNQIIKHGVRIFSKGVGEDKSGEFSLAATRTSFRSVRKRFYRRKLRKIATLRALIDFGMCPLKHSELDNWANYSSDKDFEYPQGIAFNEWLMMNPYECRLKATQGKVSPYFLGRALYHICQRRGFKSGKKDSAEGALPKDLDFLLNFQNKNPNKLLINDLVEKISNGERARLRPNPKLKAEEIEAKSKEEVKSSRLLYLAEFEAIVAKQGLDEVQKDKLYKAIFFQRPLKSQKHTVGKCTLEKSKTRALLSSPTYELFRLYQQINNIKVKSNYDPAPRPLSDVEWLKVKHLFFRKSVDLFDFEDIVKFLNKESKKTCVVYSSNYDGKKVMAAGCPTIARLMEYCGEDWQNFSRVCEYEYKDTTKKINISAYDIWHVWETMEDENRQTWAMNRLGLNEKDAEKFSRVRLKDGYASLSEKATRKILPFLEKGFVYSLSVFLANIETIIGKDIWNNHKILIINELSILLENDKDDNTIVEAVNAMITYFRAELRSGGKEYVFDQTDNDELLEKLQSNFGEATWKKIAATKQKAIFDKANHLYQTQVITKRVPEFLKKQRLEQKIKNWLTDNFDTSEEKLQKLYHPSAVETYQKAEDLLGSPMVSAVRNPMAMKALHELRHLINDLIIQGDIDDDTHIVIELARDLNDANKRKAIQYHQNDKFNQRKKDTLEIKEKYEEHFKIKDYNPTDDDLLRFRLWKEQKEKCIYTDKSIGFADLFNGELWDLEHTLPRSRSYDDSQANLTLCCADFNRKIKQNRTPFELFELGLSDKEVILHCLKHWNDEIDKLKWIVNKNKKGNGSEDKATKDARIQRKHKAQLELGYIGEKYRRFTMEEIKAGFKNSQLVDTGIITKYATLFLKSYFKRVSTVKGTATAAFRKLWGLQDNDETKSRDNHNHHLQDAIVISCMTYQRYNTLAEYYQADEKKIKPSFSKPWKNFNQDIAQILDNVLIAHSFSDNTLKQTKKKQYDEKGKELKGQFIEGKGIRGSLHKDTLYGKIIAPSDNKMHFVKRVNVIDLKDADIEKIVDEKIKALFQTIGLKKAQSEGIALPPKIAGGVSTPIHKVRIFQDKMSPMPIKKQSHRKENSEHKHFVYAANDENYALAIYKGEKERDFELVNLLKLSKSKATIHSLFPNIKVKTDKKGNSLELPLYAILQRGKSVLLLENDKDTVNWEDIKELSERLFVLKGLSIMNLKVGNTTYVYSVIAMIRHKEARTSTNLTLEGGEYKLHEKKSSYRKLYHSQFYGLVEGTDFTISPSGKITPIVKE